MVNVPASAGKTARIIEWRTTSMFSNLLNIVHILYYNANFTAQTSTTLFVCTEQLHLYELRLS